MRKRNLFAFAHADFLLRACGHEAGGNANARRVACFIINNVNCAMEHPRFHGADARGEPPSETEGLFSLNQKAPKLPLRRLICSKGTKISL